MSPSNNISNQASVPLQLKISFSVHRDLNVKGNNDKSMDYTMPQQPAVPAALPYPPAGLGAPPTGATPPLGGIPPAARPPGTAPPNGAYASGINLQSMAESAVA